MVRERTVMLIAGKLISISPLLAYLHSRCWLWFTALIGANLFQPALNRWCLPEDILEKYFDIESEAENPAEKQNRLN